MVTYFNALKAFHSPNLDPTCESVRNPNLCFLVCVSILMKAIEHKIPANEYSTVRFRCVVSSRYSLSAFIVHINHVSIKQTRFRTKNRVTGSC